MLPPATHQPLVGILTSLLNLQTSGGGHSAKRYYSFLFRDLPDKRDYADYYLLIKEPRCLSGVMDSLKKGIYSSPQAVAYDLFLVWSNAREYNEQGSQVYNDAEKLESYMEKLWKAKSPPLPAWASLPRPGTLPPPGAASTDSDMPKAKRIKIKSSSLASTSDAAAPAASTSSAVPPRGGVRQRLTISQLAPPPSKVPGSSSSFTLKLGGSRAAAATPPPPAPIAEVAPPPKLSNKIVLPMPSVLQPVLPKVEKEEEEDEDDETPEVPESRKRSREDNALGPLAVGGFEGLQRESKKERKAREKAEKAAEKAALAEAAEKGETAPHVAGIPDEDPGWFSGDIPNPKEAYLNIISKLSAFTDTSGRRIATPLLSLPDRATRADYYAQVPNPIALDVIEERVKADHYATPEAFDRDLFHLFTVAKIFIRPDSPGNVYKDLIVLQRLYQELTKRVSSHSEPKSFEFASLSSVAAGPGNLPPKQTIDGDGEYKGISNTRVTIKDKIFLDHINFKGEVLRVGDWVHLLNPDSPGKPIIAQIFKLFKRVDSPQRCISVCWYYRPEETVHPASRQFYENEVFKTSNFVDHKIEDFIERCFVMFFTRYVRGRPKAPMWTPQMPLYVVEHRYKDEVKSFKKIKNWNSAVPEEVRQHEYELEPNPDGAVAQLARVKSPFVRGVVGPGGIGEAMEHEEEEQARYHFLPGGEPATPQKLRAMKEAAEASAQAQLAAAVLYGATNTPAAAGPGPVQIRSAVAPAPVSQPVPPPPAAAASGLTPAQAAIKAQAFHPLPPSILSKFRSDADGDVLWFAAPALLPPPPKRAMHSQKYLDWRAAKHLTVANGVMHHDESENGVDVAMADV